MCYGSKLPKLAVPTFDLRVAAAAAAAGGPGGLGAKNPTPPPPPPPPPLTREVKEGGIGGRMESRISR